MANNVYIPIIDYSNEVSSVGIHVDAPTDLQITAFFSAVNGVSLGTLEKSVLVEKTNKDAGSTTPPTDKFAQRELKWLCKYTDNVTLLRYRFEIACADADLLVGNTDMIDLTAGAGLALKTAFQAAAVSPDGNAVTLNSVEFVGRNT